MQGLERHEVDFGKYDLWITDAQKTAHQCIAEKVAVDFTHIRLRISIAKLSKTDYEDTYISSSLIRALCISHMEASSKAPTKIH